MRKVISVYETKEGISRYVLGANLAIAMHGQIKEHSKEKTAVIDLSFSGEKGLETVLNIKSARSALDLLPLLSKLDDKLLKGYLSSHGSGIAMLGSIDPENKKYISPVDIQNIVRLVSSVYPVVIIIAPQEYDERLAGVLDCSDAVLITGAPHLLSLNQIKVFVSHITAWHFPIGMVKPIISSGGSANALNAENINTYIGLKVFSTIKSDTDSVVSSINLGDPAVLSQTYGDFSKDVRQLAKTLIEDASLENIDKSERERSKAETDPRDKETLSVPDTGGKEKYRRLKQKIHDEVASNPDLKNMDLKDLFSDAQKMSTAREQTRKTVQDLLSKEGGDLTREERAKFVDELLDEILGLGCLEAFLKDPDVTEIMVNGHDKIFLEKKGKILLADMQFTSPKHLRTVIDRIVSPIGRRVDESAPLVDARLLDGSRVNAVISPIALDGPTVTIRKFSKKKLSSDDLVGFGALTPQMAEFLRVCVQLRKNIVISGGTGSGKTTLLNVVSSFIPSDERIVTIEDSAELKLPQEHVVRLEARPPSVEGTGEVSIRRLVINALRMRPDRIVVGECRGGETLDMLQAMNTGHDGSLTTIHANTPKDGIARITTMVIMAGTELPERAIREQICSAVQVIVQLSRLSDGSRKVVEIAEVTGIKNDSVTLLPIFVFHQTGLKEGKVQGNFTATGNLPTFMDEIQTHGLTLDKGIFVKG